MRVPLSESYPTRSTDHHACVGHRDLSDWLAHLRLKQLMGHTSIQTTVDIYGHLGVEDARADLRLLEVEV